jgi:hypothetical protein
VSPVALRAWPVLAALTLTVGQARVCCAQASASGGETGRLELLAARTRLGVGPALDAMRYVINHSAPVDAGTAAALLSALPHPSFCEGIVRASVLALTCTQVPKPLTEPVGEVTDVLPPYHRNPGSYPVLVVGRDTLVSTVRAFDTWLTDFAVSRLPLRESMGYWATVQAPPKFQDLAQRRGCIAVVAMDRNTDDDVQMHGTPADGDSTPARLARPNNPHH